MLSSMSSNEANKRKETRATMSLLLLVGAACAVVYFNNHNTPTPGKKIQALEASTDSLQSICQNHNGGFFLIGGNPYHHAVVASKTGTIEGVEFSIVTPPGSDIHGNNWGYTPSNGGNLISFFVTGEPWEKTPIMYPVYGATQGVTPTGHFGTYAVVGMNGTSTSYRLMGPDYNITKGQAFGIWDAGVMYGPYKKTPDKWICYKVKLLYKPEPTTTTTTTTTPPPSLTFNPPTETLNLNPPATIENGMFWTQSNPATFEQVKTAVDSYGCSKINIWFGYIHHISFSTASECTSSADAVTITAPGTTPQWKMWRGAWGITFTLHSDNTISGCAVIDGRVERNPYPHGCTMAYAPYTGTQRWPIPIFMSVKRPNWYTQARSEEQNNWEYMRLVRPTSDANKGIGMCPHFEITDSNGSKNKFGETACWYSNTDWLSITGTGMVNGKTIHVGIYVAVYGGGWNKIFDLKTCSVFDSAGTATESTLVSLNAPFPFGLSASCAANKISILV